MSALRIEGDILTPQGFVRGVLEHEDGRITRIEGAPRTEDQARREAPALVLPGFIDMHVHGGGGSDTMEGGDAIERIARLHARHGTTSLLATTMTAPLSEVEAAMRALAPACASRAPGAARVLGVHLEGPYINPGKLGAQPDFVRPASIDEIHALNALAPIRLITLAPELPGNLDIIVALRAAGFRVQVGHTLGSLRRRGGRARTRRRRLHASVQRDDRHASPRAGHRRRGAGACTLRRDHSRSAARPPGRDPRRAARDSRACSA